MTRYISPDLPKCTYDPQGDLRLVKPGDFFKCAGCCKFQVFTGQYWALFQGPGKVRLCCQACRQKFAHLPWMLPPVSDTFGRSESVMVSYPPARPLGPGQLKNMKRNKTA